MCCIILIIKAQILKHNKLLKMHTIVLKNQNRSIFNFKKKITKKHDQKWTRVCYKNEQKKNWKTNLN